MKIQEILQEGGWDTTLTQGTVLHPAAVRVALQVVDQFVADFNQFLKNKGLPAIRRGRPTGSSAYYQQDIEQDPEKIYGDIDLQMIAPDNDQLTQAQFNNYWNGLANEFVQTGNVPYVDISESKVGHPIFKIGKDQYVQVDFMWHPERLASWGATRTTPERGVKGLLSGNMYSVFGTLLDMSIQHAGAQLKTINDIHVPFSKQKDTKVITVTSDPKTWIYDIFVYLANKQGIAKPKIDPNLKKYSGTDIDNVKIANLVQGVKAFARSAEANGMFGQGALSPYSSAEDFLQNFWDMYEKKALLDIQAAKRNKATTPEAIARAESDRQKVQQGLDMVRGLFNAV